MSSISRCFKKSNFLVSCTLGCFASISSSALEVTFIDQGSGEKSIQSKKVERVYPLAAPGDILCGKDKHMVRFRLNTNHAGMPFSITAKRMTKVKIRWDHPDKVLFPFPEKRKAVVFPHSGGLSNWYFRAYEPISGNVYVMNDNDVVIQTCPYSFLPAKRFRQSISMNMGKSEHDSANSVVDSGSSTLSLRYRISPKQTIPDGGNWSWSIGASQTENVSESRQVNSSISYSW